MFGRKSKEEIEYEKKLLIKRTVSTMEKQIDKLEEQKKMFLDEATEAKKKGLDAQCQLAMTGYQMTAAQQKRAMQMLMNFKITSQMKDMTMMTAEFLKGMGTLSSEMSKFADKQQFLDVQRQFESAMQAAEMQADQINTFMEMSQDSFASAEGVSARSGDRAEIERLVEENAAAQDAPAASSDAAADVEALRKKIDAMIGS